MPWSPTEPLRWRTGLGYSPETGDEVCLVLLGGVGGAGTGIQPDYWKPYDDEVPFGDRVDTVLKWLSMPINKGRTL